MRLSAVVSAVSVVAAFDNVKQATGGTLPGVVVHGKDLSILANTDAERVPNSAGDPAQLGSVGRAAEDSALGASRVGAAIGSFEGPGFGKVFPEPEDQITVGMPGEPRHAVVRVALLGLQLYDRFLLVGAAVIFTEASRSTRLVPSQVS
jgi:hypothetical protein